jgi:hypothetical protein
MAREPAEELKRVVVRMPDSLHHRLRIAAVERRTTMEAIVWQAVERELSTKSAPPARDLKVRKGEVA